MSEQKTQENQSYGDYSSKMSMLEMLTDHYGWNLIHGSNGGHLVCFRSKMKEKIASEYPFPEGKFTLRKVEERFCWWDYDPIKTQPQR